MKSVAEYQEILQILAPALWTAGGLALAAGVSGVLVLLRREALMALAIPQVVVLGAAAGLRLGLGQPHAQWPAWLAQAVAWFNHGEGHNLLGPLLAVAAALLLIAWARQRGAEGQLLPSLYIGGMCGAILLVANAGAHMEELQNLMVGMDVAVSVREATFVAPLLVILAGLVTLLWRRWLLLAQAPEVAQLAGLSPGRWNAGFLTLLALIVLLGTDGLGIVMVIALLFLPAAIVLPWSRRLPVALLAAAGVALGCVGLGFVVATEMNWPFSQSVGGVGVGLLMLSHLPAVMRR